MKYLLFLLLVPVQVLAFEPTPARQQELRHLLKHDCGACHGMTLKGGLGPALLAEALSSKSNDYLLATIQEGKPGTAMPPWKHFINQEESRWLILFLLRQQ